MVKRRPDWRAVRNVYYWNERPNFGDLLTPLLLDHFAGIRAVWAIPGYADTVMVGSILEHLPKYYGGYILGTGRLYGDSRLDLRHAQILALRGPLSARHVPGDYAIGDMGLLADELVRVESRSHPVGIVPHFSDRTLEQRPEFKGPENIIIRPHRDPLEVVHAIGSCKRIVTSSLHAIILADAFGIPRRFIYTPAMDSTGGRFKFEDYAASVGVPFELGKFQTVPRSKISDMKSELFDVLEEYAQQVGA